MRCIEWGMQNLLSSVCHVLPCFARGHWGRRVVSVVSMRHGMLTVALASLLSHAVLAGHAVMSI
jgi:hypothetical protein